MPDRLPALVLNADFRPLSYFPLSLMSWQDVIKAVFLDRVRVIAHYDRVIHSPRLNMKLPSVVSLKDYVKPARRPAFTRFHVFLRDRFTCQYCAQKFPVPELTFDHVIPRAKGGQTNWLNVVTACSGCNLRKGSLLPDQCGMFPIRKPHMPHYYALQEIGRSYPPHFLHETWRDYLYWDSELLS